MSFIRKPFRYSYRNYVMTLILVNIIIFVVFELLSIIGLGVVKQYFALTAPLVVYKGMIWQIFTYQFLHGGVMHLFFNMLALFFFGRRLEQKMGSKEFLMFYLLSGTFCGVIACVMNYFSYMYTLTAISLIGASGAIFSLLLAFAVLYPNATIFIWGIIPMPAPVMILLYGGLEIYYALFTYSNVAHSVHLFGLLIGWVYVRIRFGIKPLQVWINSRH